MSAILWLFAGIHFEQPGQFCKHVKLSHPPLTERHLSVPTCVFQVSEKAREVASAELADNLLVEIMTSAEPLGTSTPEKQCE